MKAIASMWKALFLKLRRRVGSLRIRWKIFATYVLLITITLVSLGFFSFRHTVSLEQERYLEALEHTLQMLVADMGNRLTSVEEMSEVLSWRTEMRDILSRDIAGYTFSSQMADMESLENIIRVSLTMEHVTLRLYAKNATIYTRERQNFFAFSESSYSGIYDEQAGAGTQALWVADRQVGEVSCLRFIVHKERIFEPVGLLVFTLDQKLFDTMLESSRLTANCTMLMVDGQGEPISQAGPPVSAEMLEGYTVGAGGGFTVDGMAYQVLEKTLPVEGWKLVALMPEEDLRSPMWVVVQTYLPVLVLVLTAALLLSFLFSYSVTGRVARLAAIMTGPGRGAGPDALVEVPYSDEIGEMQVAYNQMVLSRQQLIDEVYRSEIRERKAEMKALQAQINPHFLYNTLDTINWMAIEAGVPKVSGIVGLLADFFRMSLKSRDNIITVREEMTHARVYLEIQKYRMGEALEYSFEVEEQILEMAAVKLTLQPLAENAILHGILKKPAQSGRVVVAGRLLEGCVVLSVQDDGPGFLPEEAPDREGAAGYGASSTNERLRLAFGEGYGLRYERPKEGGTRAVLTMEARYLPLAPQDG